MPVKQLEFQPLPVEENLKEQLLAEWRTPSAEGNASTLPDIYEEKNADGRVAHVYVVWDKWAPYNQRKRSKIVTDAFWERYGADKGQALTMAMGLTRAEWETFRSR